MKKLPLLIIGLAAYAVMRKRERKPVQPVKMSPITGVPFVAHSSSYWYGRGMKSGGFPVQFVAADLTFPGRRVVEQMNRDLNSKHYGGA